MDCLKCKYVKIEQGSSLPYTCLKFGFCTNTYPSIRVKGIMGVECPFFTPNPLMKDTLKNRTDRTVIRDGGSIDIDV